MACHGSERIERLSLGTNNYNEFRMLQTNRSKFDWFPIDIHTFETCNEDVMAVKTNKQYQLVQTMVIYLLPPTKVSLLDSQYLKS